MIDAHHHVWAPESRPDLGYGWLRRVGEPKPFGDPTPIQRDYLWPEYLAEAGVAASVHLQTDNAVDGVAEAAWAAEGMRATGHRGAVVGLVDLSAPDAAARIAALAAIPEARGVRQIVARHPSRPDLSFASADLLADPDWRAGLRAVHAAGLRFDLQLYAMQAEAARAALPDGLPVVVDHALSPTDGDTFGWRAAVAALARRPDTAVKLSGWGMFDSAWTARSIGPMVARLLDAFGPERVMWGSNFPVERLARPFADARDDVMEAVEAAGADGAEARAVMGGTAARFYAITE